MADPVVERPKVVSLLGGEIKPPGEVRPDVVALAEEILERARSGDIMSLSVALYHSDDTNTYRHVGQMNYRQLGCLSALQAWGAAQINGD